MSDHVRKLNDTLKTIDVVLSPAALDVTGATIKTIVTTLSNQALFTRAPTVVQVTNPPTLSTTVQAGDFLVPGTYRMETEVTFANGKVQTFPEDGYLTIRVVPDLG